MYLYLAEAKRLVSRCCSPTDSGRLSWQHVSSACCTQYLRMSLHRRRQSTHAQRSSAQHGTAQRTMAAAAAAAALDLAASPSEWTHKWADTYVSPRVLVVIALVSRQQIGYPPFSQATPSLRLRERASERACVRACACRAAQSMFPGTRH